MTVDTRYATTSTYSICKYRKIGVVVIVELYDVDMKSGFSTDDVMIIASGALAPRGGTFMTSICGFNKDKNAAQQVRLNMNSSGQLKIWYMGASENITLNGSFAYLVTG